MNRSVWICVILLLVAISSGLCYFCSRRDGEERISMPDKSVLLYTTLTVVYDNNEYDSRLKTAWGFSCLVELANVTVLFDTGGDSQILLSNMETLEIDVEDIDVIVLSHIHGDHVGGLLGVLNINPNVTVYIPKSFPSSFRDQVEPLATIIDVSDPMEICDGVYTTGELGTGIKEQSLIVRTQRGLAIITGCAHPGISGIVKNVRELMNETVHLVLGGFHLGGASDSKIATVITSFREAGVEKVAPCHCTGDRAIKAFENEYRDDYVRTGVGKIIVIGGNG